MHIDQRIVQDEERIRVHLGRAGERTLKVLRAPHVLRVEHEAQRAGRRLRLVPHRGVGGIRRIPEDHHAGEAGHDVLEELQTFGAEFRIENRVAGHIAAGPRQARD